jgi:hypothetical protein
MLVLTVSFVRCHYCSVCLGSHSGKLAKCGEMQPSRWESAQDSLDVANSHLENVLQLAVKGRTEKYSGLNTENLIETYLNRTETIPIEKLIVPRAASTFVSGRNSTFLLWIDVPSFRRDEIKEVVYRLVSWLCGSGSVFRGNLLPGLLWVTWGGVCARHD